MFSRATLVDTFKILLNMQTHKELDELFFKYSLEDIAIGNSKSERCLNIVKYIEKHTDELGPLGGNLSYEIVEEIINLALLKGEYDYELAEFKSCKNLRRLLLKDGFDIDQGFLTRNNSDMFTIEYDQNLLELLLNKYDFKIAKGHYEQSISTFTRGEWAACNAQLRSYVEEIFIKIAEEITGKNYDEKSYQARIDLSKCDPPIFIREYNEWLDNGQGFFETFWKRLNPEGSHPGLSEESDSLFRLQLVELVTLELMKRLDKRSNL